MQIGSVVVAPLWRSQFELLPFDRRKQSSGPRNPVLIYKLYSDMHPSDFSSKHLFYLAIRTNDTASRWFLRQQLGVNKLGQMLKAMAKDAGFLKHKRITNHSVRKFLVQKLRNANIPPTETMAITGHKNVQSITNYSNISVEQQQKCSFLLSPVNVTIQQIPLVHLHAPKLWPKCSLDNHCLPSNKLILMFAPPSHFTVHQRSNNFASQFFGATFNIQNVNVYN